MVVGTMRHLLWFRRQPRLYHPGALNRSPKPALKYTQLTQTLVINVTRLTDT